MENELVSIITPLFNAEKYVEKTILSVIRQTYPKWEMIIVDDGSTDNSASIVKHYTDKDNRIQYLYQENKGSAAARNVGIKAAIGRYLCLLDADDEWESFFLKEQLDLLKNKNCQLVYGAHKRINEKEQEILTPYVPPKKITKKQLLKSCSISCLTALYDTVPHGKIYLREELKNLRDDFVFWLDILDKCKIAYGNQHIIASYRILPTSLTRNKWKVIIPQYNVYRKIEHLNIFQSFYYLIHWAIRGFLKYRQ